MPPRRPRRRGGDADAALTGGPTHFTAVVRSQPDPNQYAMLTVLRQQAALSAAVTDLGCDPADVTRRRWPSSWPLRP